MTVFIVNILRRLLQMAKCYSFRDWGNTNVDVVVKVSFYSRNNLGKIYCQSSVILFRISKTGKFQWWPMNHAYRYSSRRVKSLEARKVVA